MPSTAAWPYPLWVAHRGAGKLAPENTLAAFRLGAAHGYRAFECDVKLSADGVPFLLHDATLERTTSGTGLASAQPWSDLSQLDAGAWHSPAYAGEPPPSFEAIARYCLRNGHALNVEIKPTPGDEAATGAAVARAASRLWARALVPPSPAPSAPPSPPPSPRPSPAPLLSSFRAEALRAAQAAAPSLPRALLLDTLRDGWFEEARALGCVAVVTNHTLMDAALVGQLHGAGLRALCYTVNEPADAQRLLALGIDGLITDAVDRFRPSSTPDHAAG